MEALTPESVEKLISEIPNWDTDDDASMITRVWKLRDFAQCMIFANAVAEVAEEMNHHPDIYIEQDEVSLILSTNNIGGLSDKDFIVAGKIDHLPEGFGEVEKDEDFLVG
jgi:4a-hydroxytetrahydrobiopterin dehydratase